MKQKIIPKTFTHYYDEWHFSPGIDTSALAFFSGVTGTQPDGTIAKGPEEQFRDAFENLKIYLNEAKLSFDNVVEITTYHVELKKYLSDFINVKDAYILY